MGSRVDYDAPGHSCTKMAYSADGTRYGFPFLSFQWPEYVSFCVLTILYIFILYSLIPFGLIVIYLLQVILMWD